MQRLIVTSATYRQGSEATPEQIAHDPQNRLLARGPRFRVDAEVVRDLALDAAGLLDRRIGGPSVYPPQPDGVTALAYGGPSWPTSTGRDRHRRGLYTFLKRTAPYASFLTFDAPTSDTTCPRRERSNTPLQALTLLNDPVYRRGRAGAGEAGGSRGSRERRRGGTRHPGLPPVTGSPPHDERACRRHRVPRFTAGAIRLRRTRPGRREWYETHGRESVSQDIRGHLRDDLGWQRHRERGPGRLDDRHPGLAEPRRDHHQGVSPP